MADQADGAVLRVAILGYAHVGHAVAYTRALQALDGVEVAAVFDEDPDRGRHYAERFGVPAFDDDVDRVLERDDVAAVVVCAPTDAHAALVVAAAGAGKHVLCEKPIATRLDDARAMIDACQAAGVQFHVPFVSRFLPAVQAVKTVLDGGEIGDVLSIVGGNRGVPPLPPAYPPWITDPVQAGGGALIDHSVHVTDAVRYLTGAEATAVYAEAGTLIQTDLAVDDAALLLLRFDNGMVASVDPSWSLSASNPYHYDFYLRILGSDGAIDLDDTRQALHVARTPIGSGMRGFALEPFGADPDREMIRHFVRCCREKAFLPPAASGEDGLRALEIALAAYESARRAEWVELPAPASVS